MGGFDVSAVILGLAVDRGPSRHVGRHGKVNRSPRRTGRDGKSAFQDFFDRRAFEVDGPPGYGREQIDQRQVLLVASVVPLR